MLLRNVEALLCLSCYSVVSVQIATVDGFFLYVFSQVTTVDRKLEVWRRLA